MAKVPTRQEHAKLWASMSFRERRAILRAVNKGDALASRKDAKVAVGTARQQQRYWKWAWAIGPLSGLIFIPDWTRVVVYGLLLGLVMGVLAYWRYQRAVRAEGANLAVVTGRRPKDSGDDTGGSRGIRWPWQRQDRGD